MIQIIYFLLLLIPVNVVMGSLGLNTYFDYADELVIIAYLFCMLNNLHRFIRQYKLLISFLGLSILIGLISNYYSHLVNNLFPIMVDALWLLKIPFSFITMRFLAEKVIITKNNPISYFSKFSAYIICVGFILGILSLFVDLGMSEEMRYGIPIYHFIFGNSGNCGVWFLILFTIFLNGNYNNSIFLRIIEVLTIISVLLTTKGIPFMGVGTYLICRYLFSISNKTSNNSIHLKHFFIIIPILFLMATYQIDSYLKDLDSPRMILMAYGFMTARTYFPLGSGFATYGSEMASRYYSPLYVQYGFEDIYGLQDLSVREDLVGLSCLNDIYYVGLVAQLGWFGFMAFILSFVYIFREVNKMKANYRLKSICLGIVCSLFIAGIASGMPKTAMGVFAFSLIGFIVGYNKNKNHGTKNFALLLVREK